MDALVGNFGPIVDWVVANWGVGIIAAMLVWLIGANQKNTTGVGEAIGVVLVKSSGQSGHKPARFINDKVIPYVQRVTKTLDWILDGVLVAYKKDLDKKIKEANP